MIGKLIVFSAPSGSGKTTIVKALINNKELKLKFSVSATSRMKRASEIHEKDYHFLSKEEFKKKIKENAFVEWEEVYKDQFYGTLKSEIERITSEGYNVIFDIDVAGGINLKKLFKNQCFTIFIKPPSIEELKKRLINRGTETKESLDKRISKAEKEMKFAGKFDTIIINDNLDIAINDTYKKIFEFISK